MKWIQNCVNNPVCDLTVFFLLFFFFFLRNNHIRVSPGLPVIYNTICRIQGIINKYV